MKMFTFGQSIFRQLDTNEAKKTKKILLFLSQVLNNPLEPIMHSVSLLRINIDDPLLYFHRREP